jgi:putative thioredoxin
MADGQWISEATPTSFEEEVIERSRKTPVLVDFWAPWCAPCRALTPVLDAIIADRQGSLWLTKVNVDECQAQATQYGIRSVPTVKLFVDGQARGGFSGAADRRSIDDFIDRLLPQEDELAFTAGEELFDQGRLDDVEAALQPALESRKFSDRAHVLLARCQLQQGRAEEAEATLAKLTAGTEDFEKGQAMLLRVDMVRKASGHTLESLQQRLETNPKDSEAYWALAGLHLQQGDLRNTFEALLELIQRDRQYQQDGARRTMLALFDEIGIHHELSRQYRKQLSIYL